MKKMSLRNNVNFDAVRSELKDCLCQCFRSSNIDQLEQKVKFYKNTEIETKPALDQSFRDLLLDLLESEPAVAVLKNLVQFAIETCRTHLTNPTIPVVLLGDIFDTLPLDSCQIMFGFVEDNVQVWKEELFFSACKNNLLRLCNDLLRRLSRTTATVFCGKILLFLAKFFPFSERSGLNIVSEFNLENITEYGADASDDIVTEIESRDNQKHVIDFTFYCKFWQLQDFFRNPNQCYEKVQWKLFCQNTTNILTTFQGIQLDYVTFGNSGNVGYFAKYLTNQKLLDLQLHDVSFRRSVLLQFLIVFQYLTSPVKFKSENYDLKVDQKEWIQNATTKVYNLLKETPPDGETFSNIVRNILSREELWNSWKNEGCPEIKKSLPQAENEESERTFQGNRPLAGDLIKESLEKGQYYMGSPELTKLWNLCPDNLEACKGKERDFLPSLEEYFADAIAQLEQPVKEESSLLKDSNYGWRALRLLVRRSPHFFTYSNTIMNPLSSYLDMMVRKIAHERPGRNDENSQEGGKDEEMEEGLLTEENATDDLKQTENEDFIDDTNPRKEEKHISAEKLRHIVEKISNWEKLAVKLGFSQEIDFFKTESSTPTDQALHMIRLWFEDDEDANFDNLLYTLEGLDMKEAADALRNELNNTLDM